MEARRTETVDAPLRPDDKSSVCMRLLVIEINIHWVTRICTDTLVRSNGCVQQAATKATSDPLTNWAIGTYWMPRRLCEEHELVAPSQIGYVPLLTSKPK